MISYCTYLTYLGLCNLDTYTLVPYLLTRLGAYPEGVRFLMPVISRSKKFENCKRTKCYRSE